MTEKEKMIAGEKYDLFDPELNQLRLDVQAKVMELNMTADAEKRKELISSLLGKTGENMTLVSPFHCDYGCNITLGDNVYINTNCVFLDCAPITIGSNVLIAPSVQLYAAGHPLDYMERRVVEIAKPIVIEDDCWIGGGVIICQGVRIGARSVIAAGSVVVKDVECDSLMAGNPAVLKRKLNV